MKRDEFEPSEHDPEETKNIELELTVEMYEFEDKNGWIEARYYVVRNNWNDHYSIHRDEDDVKRFWIDIAYELKQKVKSMWQP